MGPRVVKADLERILLSLNQDELAALTAGLIDIPSPVGRESAVAEYLYERLSAAGLKARLQEVEPGRLNVIGRLQGKGTGPSLLYLGHLDTAWAGDEEGIPRVPGWQPTASRDGEWIYGLGAYNMKSGLACAVYAVEQVAKEYGALGGDLLVAGVVGETAHAQVRRYQGARYRGLGTGARSLLTQGVNADLAVIPEPTAGNIDIATGGYLLFEVSTSGHPGATYRRGTGPSDEADDAIRKAFAIVQAVDEWAADYIQTTRYQGKSASNVALISIEGGHPWRPSKTASFCRLYFEVQVPPHVPLIDVEMAFRGLVRGLAEHNPTLEAEVEVIQCTPGAEIDQREPVVRHLAASHAKVFGHEPARIFDGWYADSTVLTRFGIPTAVYGPAGRMRGGGVNYYPREGEMCSIEDLMAGTRVFVEMAYDVCNRPRSEFTAKSRSRLGTVVR